MSTKEIFAARLLALREKNNLSRQELAAKLGITRSALEYYEKAKRTPDIEMIAKISKCFHVSVDYLFGLSEMPNQDENLQMISSYTNLDENALLALHLCTFGWGEEHFVQTVNKVIASPHFMGLVAHLEKAGAAVNKRTEATKKEIEYMNRHDALGDEQVVGPVRDSVDRHDLEVFRANQRVISILNQIYQKEITELNLVTNQREKKIKEIIQKSPAENYVEPEGDPDGEHHQETD